MLQFSSSPITPRPRPPRSRSSQLSSGSNLGATGTTTTPSMLTAATFVDEQLSKQLTSLVASAGPGSEIAPDTPPYTPELPLYEGHEREGPGDCHRAGEGEMQTMGTRTAKELEDMLAGAQRIIRDRERGWSLLPQVMRELARPAATNALRGSRPWHSRIHWQDSPRDQQRIASEAGRLACQSPTPSDLGSIAAASARVGRRITAIRPLSRCQALDRFQHSLLPLRQQRRKCRQTARRQERVHRNSAPTEPQVLARWLARQIQVSRSVERCVRQQ